MRKIAIFTGSRAEYGLQYPILRAIAADQRLEYFLLAGGTHLAQEFGGTLAEIESDGFQVYRPVKVPVRPPSQAYTAQSIADVIQTMSCILSELRPDFLLVYADRFESFGAVVAASQMNIPVAHVEGGDYTEGGALDDSVRHAMTKLSHLHFTTNAQAAERVLKLGEEPWRVENVGLPALDLARAGIFAQPDELTKELGFDLAQPIVVFCQHSITTEQELALEQLRPSVAALKHLAAEGFQILMTYPNNDAGGQALIGELGKLADERIAGIRVIKSLGRRRFHGMLHLMGKVGRGVLAGNSSAGVKETTAFGCPCVNIGSRQAGRLRAGNVIDVPYDADAIAAAIHRAVEDADFRSICAACENPYGQGDAGQRIAETLATVSIGPELLRKKLTY